MNADESLLFVLSVHISDLGLTPVGKWSKREDYKCSDFARMGKYIDTGPVR